MFNNCVPRRQLGSCSVTRPILSLQRVWLVRLVEGPAQKLKYTKLLRPFWTQPFPCSPTYTYIVDRLIRFYNQGGVGTCARHVMCAKTLACDKKTHKHCFPLSTSWWKGVWYIHSSNNNTNERNKLTTCTVKIILGCIIKDALATTQEYYRPLIQEYEELLL